MTTSAEAPPLSARAVWLTLIVVLLADAMDLMDATIANVAAPSIVKELGVGENVIPWLGASYALALGSLLVLGGRIGDKFGQRRTFLTGLIGFIVGSALAGFAPSAGVLIAARVAQGAFGALLIPQDGDHGGDVPEAHAAEGIRSLCAPARRLRRRRPDPRRTHH
ncbi:MFS transporter [Cellulosimicrobium sp. CUA-896]|uniref:MFS transporter n=1 Tax=Cellulosimicrobium sp. CUA-896 TaxID=1517881 RepID=UPI001C9E742D|nr:MFS transporter [Cellulosimicrobium sp. CUA-896]